MREDVETYEEAVRKKSHSRRASEAQGAGSKGTREQSQVHQG